MNRELVTLDTLDRYALLRESLRLNVESLHQFETALMAAKPPDDANAADFICWLRTNLLESTVAENMTDVEDGYTLVELLVNDGMVSTDIDGSVHLEEDMV